MNNLADDQTDNPTSPQSIPLQQQPLPDSLGKTIAVPEEIVNAGKPTDLPRDTDSPETLDEDLAKESDINDIEKLHIPAYGQPKTNDDADDTGEGEAEE
jgi:hypothetical protein